jgi:hypothetical protein
VTRSRRVIKKSDRNFFGPTVDLVEIRRRRGCCGGAPAGGDGDVSCWMLASTLGPEFRGEG